MQIKLNVSEHLLTLAGTSMLAGGSENVDTIKVTFDSTWNGFGKLAVFNTEKTDSTNVAINTDGIATIPSLKSKKYLRIGIVGIMNEQTYTTNVIKVYVEDGAVKSESEAPADDVYHQILSMFGEMTTTLSNIIDDSAPASTRTYSSNKIEKLTTNLNRATMIAEGKTKYGGGFRLYSMGSLLIVENIAGTLPTFPAEVTLFTYSDKYPAVASDQTQKVVEGISITLTANRELKYSFSGGKVESGMELFFADSVAEDTQINELANKVSAIQSEVIDARTGYDGTSYDTLGTAIRTQVNNLNEDLDKLNEGGLVIKDEVIAKDINNWLDNHPEATTTVQDKSLTIDKMVVGTLGYVTPEMFGAVGDGMADDTEAIINAINFGVENNKPVFAFKKYATSDTITISGLYFTFYLHGEIIYSGTDEAILITNCSRSKFIFTKISALNGTCIKMYSNSNSENRVSYCDLSFKFLNSLENCIEIEIDSNGGYCNENIIRGGWLAGGKYGIYADAKGRSEIQFKAYNVGFENVGCGFYLNGTNGCTFIAPRYAEQSKILKARNAKYILIIAMDKFYTTKIDIDDTVTGQIIAPIAERYGGVHGFRGIFNSGYVNPIDWTNAYLNALTSIDLTAEENYLTKLPRYIVVNNNCNYIKLNKMYGSTTPASIGIDEFTCKFAFDSGKDFKIYDADGNIIFNNTSNCGWKECRFKFYQQIGWTCEILNSITKLVI